MALSGLVEITFRVTGGGTALLSELVEPNHAECVADCRPRNSEWASRRHTVTSYRAYDGTEWLILYCRTNCTNSKWGLAMKNL